MRAFAVARMPSAGSRDWGSWSKGMVAGPLVGGGVGGGAVGRDGGEGGGGVDVAANGDAADGVVGDVAVVVGVDEVEGEAEVGEGGLHGGPVGGGVDGEEVGGEGGGVVEGPVEAEGAALVGVEAGDEGGLVGAVLGEGDGEGDVGAAADVDDLVLVADGPPGAGGGLVLGAGGGAAGVLDVDVLDVGAEVGEAPGDVLVVADDDEGSAGEGDSGGVEGGLRGG